MRTLIIGIQDEATAMQALKAGFIDTWQKDEYKSEYLMFESPTALFKAISLKRWVLISQLQFMGKTSQRALAKELELDIHCVHDDVNVLKAHGIIEQDDAGIHIPY
jgi:predicted transcriptional regulator